jgi:hypothetical protein
MQFISLCYKRMLQGVKRLTEWWDYCFQRRKAERLATMSLMRCTVYGSFQPPEQKKQLESLSLHLRSNGFTNVDIIGGPLRPHPIEYNSYQISIFYLEESDVNLLVYTLTGSRLGLTTECDHVLNSPSMFKRWNSCIILNQTDPEGKDSIGQLQKDRIMEINSGQQRIPIVPFETYEELAEIAYYQLIDFHKALGSILRQRINL